MGQTTILDETVDHFNGETGEIYQTTRRKIKKTKIEPTDEFVKVSKYLNTIFAYNNIPLNLVPISLLIAQEMEFKTNIIYLLKPRKEEFAEMLGISLDRVNKLIKDCQKYNIIRPVARATYEVNSYLFSTGTIAETRNLQAHFDFDRNVFVSSAVQTNRITGETVRKAVINKKDQKAKQLSIAGQLCLTENGIIEEG